MGCRSDHRNLNSDLYPYFVKPSYLDAPVLTPSNCKVFLILSKLFWIGRAYGIIIVTL